MRAGQASKDTCSSDCDGEFLDSVAYTRRRVLRYESIFGRCFVSTGGLESTKKLTRSLLLPPAARVLDVGCGAGGSAFHLARQFDVASVVGCDLSANMVAVAEERKAEQEEQVMARVSFHHLDVTLAQFPADHFDLVYSRDCIMHIADKEKRWLKPGGRLLVTEYLRGPNASSDHRSSWTDYRAFRRYKLITSREYEGLLRRVGFRDVEVSDITDDFLQALERESTALRKNRVEFVQSFSDADFEELMEGWKVKSAAAESGLLEWGLMTAVKEQG